MAFWAVKVLTDEIQRVVGVREDDIEPVDLVLDKVCSGLMSNYNSPEDFMEVIMTDTCSRGCTLELYSSSKKRLIEAQKKLSKILRAQGSNVNVKEYDTEPGEPFYFTELRAVI